MNLHNSFNKVPGGKKKKKYYRQTYHHCCLCSSIFFHQIAILEGLIFRSPFFQADLLPPCGNNIFRIKTDFQLAPQAGFLMEHQIQKCDSSQVESTLNFPKAVVLVLFLKLWKKNLKPVLAALMINKKIRGKILLIQEVIFIEWIKSGSILAVWFCYIPHRDQTLLYLQQHLLNSFLLFVNNKHHWICKFIRSELTQKKNSTSAVLRSVRREFRKY